MSLLRKADISPLLYKTEKVEIMSKKKKYAIAMLSAILTYIVLSTALSSMEYLNADLSNCLHLLWIVLFYILFRQAIELYEIRNVIITTIVGFMLSLIINIGGRYMYEGSVFFCDIVAVGNILSIVFMALIFSSLLLWLYQEGMSRLYYCTILQSLDKKVRGYSDIKCFLIFTIILGVLLLPAYIALFPGYLSYDGPTQIAQVYTDNGLDDWQPVGHTLFIKFCLFVGSLFDSIEIGIAFYTTVQGILLICVLSYMNLFMFRRRVSFALILVNIIFEGLSPLNQIFTFAVTKDSMFSIFFLFSFLNFIEVLTTTEKFIKNKVKISGFVLSLILMCVMKKQGVYIIAC